MSGSKSDVVQGTLDLLILRILRLAPMHGYGISQRLEQMSEGVFRVNPGSLFPALHKLEQKGWIAGEWGRSDNNRRAKFYRLTPAGRRRLETATSDWERVAYAIHRVLEAT